MSNDTNKDCAHACNFKTNTISLFLYLVDDGETFRHYADCSEASSFLYTSDEHSANVVIIADSVAFL